MSELALPDTRCSLCAGPKKDSSRRSVVIGRSLSAISRVLSSVSDAPLL